MSGRFFFKNGFSAGAVAQAAAVLSVTPTHVRWVTTSGLTLDGVGFGLSVETPGLGGTFTSIVARDPQGNLVFDISGIMLTFSDAADGFTIAQLLGGNDVLEASSAPDAFDGGAGFDYVSYVHADGGVVVNFGNNTSGGAAAGDTYRNVEGILGSRFGDALTGDENANNLFGFSGDDAIFALGGTDFVKGEDGNDTLNGGSGDDTLDGGAGGDIIAGGAGFDYVSYVDSTTNVIVNLGNNQNGAGAAGDVISEVEGILGSRFGDALTGDENANNIFGNAGDDAIFTLGGADFVKGEDGNDTLNSGSGDDMLDGGAGADRLEGGDGFDYARYDNSAGRVLLDLIFSNGTGGEAQGDTVTSIEGVTATNASDGIWGSNVQNAIYLWAGNDYADGRGGDDFLFGGDGNDTLVGGSGADRLYGQAGNDVFVFGLGDLQPGVRDIIEDFSAGDRIVFQGLVPGTYGQGQFGSDVLLWVKLAGGGYGEVLLRHTTLAELQGDVFFV